MHDRICDVRVPPPIASNASVAPVAAIASIRSARKLGVVLSSTWVAPSPRSSATCSALRTMLTSGTRSSMQIRTSIWPRFDAAAVWTSAVWPSRRITSTIDSAVIGLTYADAPCAAVAPSGRTMQSAARATLNRVYMPPPANATTLPTSSRAASPASTTVPAPSLPTVSA